MAFETKFSTYWFDSLATLDDISEVTMKQSSTLSPAGLNYPTLSKELFLRDMVTNGTLPLSKVLVITLM